MSEKADRAIAYQLIRDSTRWSLWPLLMGILVLLTWERIVRSLRPITPKVKLDVLPAPGTCLRPWILDGDLIFFARELEARPGDLVVHATLVEIRAGLGTPGKTLELLGAKQLKVDGRRRRWLTCADGAYQADPDHTVLGPIVAVARRPGWPWRRRAPLTGINFAIAPATAFPAE